MILNKLQGFFIFSAFKPLCIFNSWGFRGVAYNSLRINEAKKETKNKEQVLSQAQNEAEKETMNKLFILIS